MTFIYEPTFDLSTPFPELEKRTTQVLLPRRTHVENQFVSKLGGKIAWPRNEPWPVCSGTNHALPLIPILQLRADDCPDLWLPPGKQVLQLLWCPFRDSYSIPHYEDDQEYYSSIPKLYWRTYDALNEYAGPQIPDPEGYCVPNECELNIQTVAEFPSLYIDNEPLLRDVNRWIVQNGREDLRAIGAEDESDPYEESFSVCPLSKVGGFCRWDQDPQGVVCNGCATPMRFLLSIVSKDYADPPSRWVSTDQGSTSEHSHDLCFGDVMPLHVSLAFSKFLANLRFHSDYHAHGDIWLPQKARRLFNYLPLASQPVKQAVDSALLSDSESRVTKALLCGHTHVPGLSAAPVSYLIGTVFERTSAPRLYPAWKFLHRALLKQE
ncbi:hypothetical protein FGB62_95g089 [Gracilaria domingensis]|nr:hypothetical protein FGB62_95g089 [Gracilaria domingensis]